MYLPHDSDLLQNLMDAALAYEIPYHQTGT